MEKNLPGTFDVAAGATTSRLLKLSQDLLYAVRIRQDASDLLLQISNVDEAELFSSLPNDQHKKAFWINLYNGFTQHRLRQNPAAYQHREEFFRAKQVVVAGHRLSLDDIEHGVLRRSRVKWSLGYLGKIFPAPFEKTCRVQVLDGRIHFALNCGAKSCPPIAFYTPQTIDQQLDLATRSYLQNEVEQKGNTVFVPAVLSWFRGDFGGKKGIRKLLQQSGFTAIGSSTKLRFKPYCWDLDPDHGSSF